MTPPILSLERQIKMHEAREGIIDRLAAGIPAAIDLDRFLGVTVSELGRMMDADRCDVIQLTAQSELRISHEWRAADDVPSSLGTVLPVSLQQLADYVDLAQPLRFDDTSAPGLDKRVHLLAQGLQTRSLVVVPIELGRDVLGLIGLHDTHAPRRWLDEEVSFLQSIARHIAVGYQYTRLYIEQQRETARTNALLEIANTLNAQANFKEVTSHVMERCVALVGADYGALGVLDATGKRISLAAFQYAPNVEVGNVRALIEEHGQAIDISTFPFLREILTEGKTLKVVDTELPFAARFIFNATLGGRAALVAPVRIGGHTTFGFLGFVWSDERTVFARHEVALVEGIADQIGTALERDQLSVEVMRLRSALHERETGGRIIGQAPPIRRVIELALSVADTNTTVLLQGESGTGKELLANLIHYNSGREDKPYIKLNCGAIPETLLESELFGHEKGAFTDARARRRGRFEEADGGTLFLDEIGDMSLSAQVRLLRVLQDGEFTRVGGNEILKTDVRVVAATNIDLAQAADEGRFRRDVYYRLSVFPINLPPLRERRADIHPLMVHFLERYQQKTGRFVAGVAPDALQALIKYDWPGNVRELENAIERAVIIASGRAVELGDLPEAVRGQVVTPEQRGNSRSVKLSAARNGDDLRLELALPATLEDLERQIIEATLAYTGGDKARAARTLGIGRKTLYRKLEQYE